MHAARNDAIDHSGDFPPSVVASEDDAASGVGMRGLGLAVEEELAVGPAALQDGAELWCWAGRPGSVGACLHGAHSRACSSGLELVALLVVHATVGAAWSHGPLRPRVFAARAESAGIANRMNQRGANGVQDPIVATATVTRCLRHPVAVTTHILHTLSVAKYWRLHSSVRAAHRALVSDQVAGGGEHIAVRRVVVDPLSRFAHGLNALALPHEWILSGSLLVRFAPKHANWGGAVVGRLALPVSILAHGDEAATNNISVRWEAEAVAVADVILHAPAAQQRVNRPRVE
mmetsp:Transcript_23556/g.26153  ORF Transcript_23556/g.26153 Transcript_23556/m.26153 type:complete len:289 (-) Transcript_23556:3321-4187(-)